MYRNAPEQTTAPPMNYPRAQDFPEHFSSANRFRRIAKVASAALVVTSIGGYYGIDVYSNRQREQSASIQLTNHSDQSNPDLDTSTFSVAIDGYGSMNGTLFTQKMGPLTSNITGGPYYSADFGDAPIDATLLSEEIRATAKTADYEFVSLSGFSAGGTIALETAQKTIQDSDLRMDAIFLTSTPSGIDSLRPDRIEQLWWLNTISKAPGAKYSSMVRWIISMVSDVNQYSDGTLADFIKVWNENLQEIQRRAEPGVAQLDDQALAIANADITATLRTIGAMRGNKQMPVIVYLGAKDPATDTSVATDKAAEDICTAAHNANIQCLVYTVPNAVHSVYHLDTTAYRTILEAAHDEIQSAINQERSYYELLNPVSRSNPLHPLR